MSNSEQIGSNNFAVAEVEPSGQQTRRADDRFRRLDEEDVSKFESASGRIPANQQRFAIPHRLRLSGLALRCLIGLLAAACIGLVLRSYGDAVRQLIPQWGLQLSAPATTGNSSSPQATISKATSLQSASDQAPLTGNAPTATDSSPGQEQLAPLLRGFLAVVEQDIEELKASIEQLKSSQEQLVRSNAAVAEQIKTSQEQIARDNEAVTERFKVTQEQMARLLAKESDQQLRPKTSAPAVRSVATSTTKPLPQTRSQTPAPPRARPQ